MGDKDDRLALGDQPAHDLEQFFGFLGREHRRGLVEDQDLGLTIEGFDDLHPLLHADRDVLNECIGVHDKAVLIREIANSAARRAPIKGGGDDRQGRIGSNSEKQSEEDVEGDSLCGSDSQPKDNQSHDAH